MKSSKVLAAGASVAVAVGVLLIGLSIPASSESTDFTIQEGGYYYLFETATLLNGEVSGTFEVAAGDNVTVYVFTSGQYDAYKATNSAQSLSTDTGASGSFSAAQGGIGRLYVVFAHASQSQEATTDVHMAYTVSGISLAYLGYGAAVIAIGVAAWVFGTMALKREARGPPKQRDE